MRRKLEPRCALHVPVPHLLRDFLLLLLGSYRAPIWCSRAATRWRVTARSSASPRVAATSRGRRRSRDEQARAQLHLVELQQVAVAFGPLPGREIVAEALH